MLALECLNAKEGDCLILHYGDPSQPRFVLIDSGTRGTYNAVLKPRLMELKAEFGQGGPLVFELAMVSHIDGDHITGFIDYFRKVGAGTQPDASLVEYRKFWHNSLRHLVSGNIASTSSTDGGPLTASTVSILANIISGSASSDSRTAAILASYGQGTELEGALVQAGLANNPPISGVVSSTWPEIVLPDDAKVTITGPIASRVKDLQDDWPQDADNTVIAAYLDRSVPNLSSISCLFSIEGKTIFFTGDARGDDLIAGLEEKGLLDDDGSIHIDVLKMPHHGSNRNIEVDFLKKVIAGHYVFSADGKHDNPDHDVFDMLREARPGAKFAVHLTNPVSLITEKMHADPALLEDAIANLKQACEVEWSEREDGQSGVTILLED